MIAPLCLIVSEAGERIRSFLEVEAFDRPHLHARFTHPVVSLLALVIVCDRWLKCCTKTRTYALPRSELMTAAFHAKK